MEYKIQTRNKITEQAKQKQGTKIQRTEWWVTEGKRQWWGGKSGKVGSIVL